MPLPNALRGIWRTRSFGGEAGHPFMITIVCGTRHSAHDFAETTPLGASLKRLAFDKRINTHIAFGGNPGLPLVYNKALEAPDVAEILVFIHDDVWIDDYFFVDRVAAGLQSFDIIGVAGNRRRVARQPAWLFGTPGPNNVFTKDRENHSGAVAHGKTAFGRLTILAPHRLHANSWMAYCSRPSVTFYVARVLDLMNNLISISMTWISAAVRKRRD